MRRPRLHLAWLALALACAHSAADHEELGDREYAARAYRDALAEYQLGLKAQPTSGDLLAKAGAAALHTGEFGLAAADYVTLGQEDRSRAAEAADGLERVVRAALAANDRKAAVAGLQGLRTVAPDRPLGKYARLAALDAAERGDTGAALALLPSAVAAAGGARTADSLLFAYGMAAVRARACSTAVPVFEAVIRRQREPAVADDAREGLGLCALVEGQRLLDRGRPADAEAWFRRATAPGSPADVVRGAFLGLGDLKLAQGDVAGALESYQQAMTGGSPGDTIAQQAQQKINALGKADAPEPPRQP
ncbi:MAG TPA: tetratricopeptide repeat protein [Gemmatimonadales bacterium]|nr:tetratricopeptide repeat protein [Gemmatimonadales bacterium]